MPYFPSFFRDASVGRTHSDAIMEDFMPILIRHHDNNINLPGEVKGQAFGCSHRLNHRFIRSLSHARTTGA
jgi:hypothetical protein